ncbi:unnamed protein product [Cuscuta epithymum]|uniref:RNase H type-1 domain-containing protein n=1 Tax=Cuscuta epithymum TaxID=186058 RepID=A0AAV0FUE8_9ASTE|nr:unnamed protein product [Cuscuta epithymum]
MALWGVWNRRNSFVWNDDWQQTAGLLNGCASVLRAWRDAQQQVAGVGSSSGGSSSAGWVKPRSGRIKVNVDAALDLTKDIRAWSWVARNDQGEFIKAGGGSREAHWSPEEAEAYGLREAIRTAIKEGWDLVDFESDAQVVVRGLGKRGGLAYMDLILDDIHFLIHTKRSFSISYCKRSANRVAHALARSHVSISDHSFSYESIPRSIVSLMANDLLLI